MKKRYLQAGLLLFILVCTAAGSRYALNSKQDLLREEPEKATISLEEQEAESQIPLLADKETGENESPLENVWFNFQDSRIAYGKGCYFYDSQSDHYYLYRADEDGGNPRCLAKVHAGDICVQGDTVYFRVLGSERGIYRINMDGTGMKKLCMKGCNLQFGSEYIFFLSDNELYCMEKDSLTKYFVAQDVSQYQLVNNTLYYSKSDYRAATKDYTMQVTKLDLTTQNKKELCRFDPSGKLVVIGDDIYCIGEEKISCFSQKNRTMESFDLPVYTDSCSCQGYFYGLYEETEEDNPLRKVSICRIDLCSQSQENIYEYVFQCEESNYPQGNLVSDLYATEKDVFFRRFVSEQEGCQWFRLLKDGNVQAWENRDAIPNMLPARNIEDSNNNYDTISVRYLMESTERYGTYLAADLTYEESYHVAGGDFSWDIPFEITLPQFNSKIAGYRQINAYFQNAYQEGLQDKDTYFKTVAEEDPEITNMWFQSTSYGYIYIGEQYITVEQRWDGYWGGVRGWYAEEPVTFDRTTGETVSLETLLGMPTDEAVSMLTASVYKYWEGVGRGKFLLRDWDRLTESYNPDKFFLFPDGIGIYYEFHAIGSTADRDFLFIVPYEEFPEAF